MSVLGGRNCITLNLERRLASFAAEPGPRAVIRAAAPIAVNTALLVGASYWLLTRDFNMRAERSVVSYVGGNAISLSVTTLLGNLFAREECEEEKP